MLAQSDTMQTSQVILMVAQLAILPLIGWMIRAISSMSRESRDLWEWHKPDDSGKQQWKNPGVEKSMNTMISELRGLREDMREVVKKKT